MILRCNVILDLSHKKEIFSISISKSLIETEVRMSPNSWPLRKKLSTMDKFSSKNISESSQQNLRKNQLYVELGCQDILVTSTPIRNLSYRCQTVDFELPPVPTTCSGIQRLILRCKLNENGYWVHINYRNEFMYVVKIRHLIDLISYVMRLCGECSLPKHNCSCEEFSTSWQTLDYTIHGEELLMNNKSITSYMTPKDHIDIIEDMCFNCGSFTSSDSSSLEEQADIKIHYPSRVEQLTDKLNDLLPNIDHLRVDLKQAIIDNLGVKEEVVNYAYTAVDILENIGFLILHLREVRNTQDVIVAFTVFAKLMYKDSLVKMTIELHSFISSLFNDFFLEQAGEASWLETVEDFIDDFDRVSRTRLGRKITKVINHIVVQSILHKMNVQIDRDIYTLIEKEDFKISKFEVVTFIAHLTSLIVTSATVIRQCVVSKSISPIFVDGTSASKWFIKVCKIESEYDSLGMTATSDNRVHEFLRELRKCIAYGRRISELLNKNHYDWNKIMSAVLRLEAIETNYLAIRMAQSMRVQPFCVVLYGEPGVGKSSVLDFIYQCVSAKIDVNPDNENKYVFNAAEQYMNNFKSYMHTCVLDDVAQHAPSKIQGIDPTLEHFICMVNNIPWNTPQASLSNKGNAPFLCKQVYVTTNKVDMNIPIYYPQSSAPFRRINIHIEPIIKDEYKGSGPNKFRKDISPEDKEKADFWKYKIRELEFGRDMRGQFVEKMTLNNKQALHDYVINSCKAHFEDQDNMIKQSLTVKKLKKCEHNCIGQFCSDCKNNIIEQTDMIEETNVDEEMKIEDEPIVENIRKIFFKGQDASMYELETNFKNLGSDIQDLTFRNNEGDVITLVFDIHIENNSITLSMIDRPCANITCVQNTLICKMNFGKIILYTTIENVTLQIPQENIIFPYNNILYCESSEMTQSFDTVYRIYREDEVMSTISGQFMSLFSKINLCEKTYIVVTDTDREQIYLIPDDDSTTHIRLTLKPKIIIYVDETDNFNLEDFAQSEYFKCPWRKFYWMLRKSPRSVHAHTCSVFKEKALHFYAIKKKVKLSKNDVSLIHYFSIVFVPQLFKKGCTDKEVWDECQAFMYYCNNKTDVPRLKHIMESLNSVTEAPATEPKIQEAIFASRSAFENLNVFYKAAFAVVDFIAYLKFQIFGIKIRTDKLNLSKLNFIGNHIDKSTGAALAAGTLTLVTILTTIATITGTYHIVKKYKNKAKNILQKPIIDNEIIIENITTSKMEEQLLIETEFERPVYHANEKGNNIWLEGHERSVTSVNFLDKRTMHCDSLIKKLALNCYKMSFVSHNADGTISRYTNRVILLSNDNILVNNHALPTGGDIICELFYGNCEPKVHPSVEFKITQSDIYRREHLDFAVITTKALPIIFSNIIMKNISRNCLNGTFNGYYLTKSDDGTFLKRRLIDIHQATPQQYECDTHYTGTYWTAINIDQETRKGDCGSIMIAETGYGPVILGFHSLAIGKRVFAVMIDEENISMFFDKLVVQSGSIDVTPFEMYERKTSYVDFHEEGKIFRHGEINKFTRFKHHVRKTEINRDVFDHFGVEDNFSPPKVGSYKAQQNGLKEMLLPVSTMKENIIKNIAETFVDHIVTNLSKDELSLITPTNLDVAINGMPGMYAVDAIKKNTSKGWPEGGCKLKVMIKNNDPFWQDGYTFTDDVKEVIEEKFKQMQNGIRTHPIYVCNLKDEVSTKKKAEIYKVRQYYSAPLYFLIISRMLFLNFSRVFMRNRFLFMHAIGMNCHSIEWQNLLEYLSIHGLNRLVAGDFKYFDKKIQIMLSRWIYWTIVEICLASGNFDELKLVLNTFSADAVSPTVDFFGMIISLLGGEVSGHQITTVFNCLLDTFYLMYCYELCGYDIKNFFTNVSLITLGDDHVFSTCDDNFHHTNIQKILTALGLGYTMADKESDSVPFITIDRVDFLKRKFQFNSDLNSWVAPLDKTSIYKMLTYQVSSKTVCASEQLAQSIVSATTESFFHGRDFYDEMFDFIKNLSPSEELKVYMQKYPIFTYKQIIERFVNSIDDVQYAAWRLGRNQNNQFLHSYCSVLGQLSLNSERMDVLISETLVRAKYLKDRCDTDIKNYNFDMDIELQSSVEIIKLTENMNKQSTVLEDYKTTNVDQEQNQFINEVTSENLDISNKLDPAYSSQIVDQQLAAFLKRPIEIANFTWTENAPAGFFSIAINPWYLYLGDPAISNKIKNFSMYRGTLKLKFIINASQFYYGSLMVAYTPLKYTQKSIDTAPVSVYQTAYSQRPHVWLDPQTSSSAEMTLPYVNFLNFSRLATGIDSQRLGVIDFIQYAALRSANGVTTGGVTVIVYAWMEDIELTGLTSNSDLVMQSDEYKMNGQISGPASTFAKYADKLSDAPIIGDYAKATSYVANKIGKVASIFGFTNVPNINDVTPMKSLPFHTLASSQISEPINKLSLQPKQETSLFGKMDTANEDPMLITNFVSKEAFLTGTLYTSSQAENTVLFTTCVKPHLVVESAGAWTLPPLGFASTFFDYWRGDIIFKIKVIKTMYHRGRLNICWDQDVTDASKMPLSGRPSAYNVIMDLSETDTVELRVPFMSVYPFLENTQEFLNTSWSNGPSPTFTTTNLNSNGMLQIRVLNRLTAPEATSDVDILVFVKGSDNIEFARPKDIIPNQNIPVQQSDVVTFGKASFSDPHVYDEMIGEKIISFRELLHRQSKSFTENIFYTPVTNNDYHMITIPIRRLPKFAGYALDGKYKRKGVTVPGSDFNYNYCAQHPMTQLVSCFLGYKGSVNVTVNAQKVNVTTGNFDPISKLSMTRENLNGITDVVHHILDSSTNLNVQQDFLTYQQMNAGTGQALTSQVTQAGLSVNLPYYINNKFTYVNCNNLYNHTTRYDALKDDGYVLELTLKDVASITNRVLIDVYYGTGPDFDVTFFLNVPVMYWNVGALP